MCWRAGRGLAGKAPFWLSLPVRSLEQRGRYMVSQAFRKPKVLCARAFTMQTREGPGTEGADPRPRDVSQVCGSPCFQPPRCLSIEVPARSHSWQRRRKRNSCPQCSKAGSRLSLGREVTACLDRSGWLSSSSKRMHSKHS